MFRIKKSILQVEVERCVHYAGFYYGGGTLNPYEDYMRDALLHGLEYARERFLNFLVHYRPTCFLEALGYGISSTVPLWAFPWDRSSASRFGMNFGWHLSQEEIPDIITHFHADGVMQHRAVEEFSWLERALYRMKNYGYQPDRHTYCRVWQLELNKDSSKFLLTDGNHRVAAQSVLGLKELPVVVEKIIKYEDLECWPMVAKGFMSKSEAAQIFLAYFENRNKYCVGQKAKLLTCLD